MTLIKGMNRIIIILAIISIPFCYFLGNIAYREHKTIYWEVKPNYPGVIINKFGVHVLPIREEVFTKEIPQEELRKFNIPVPNGWNVYSSG